MYICKDVEFQAIWQIMSQRMNTNMKTNTKTDQILRPSDSGILIISSFLFFLVILFSCNQKEQNIALIENALDDRRRHSVFLEVENKSNTYIIENANCYKYLSLYNDLSFEEYKQYMIRSYKKHHKFVINEDIKDISDDWIPVHNKLSTLNKKEIISTFFNNNKVIKKGIPLETKNEIIQRLFQLNVLCSTDCESGFLIIIYN